MRRLKVHCDVKNKNSAKSIVDTQQPLTFVNQLLCFPIRYDYRGGVITSEMSKRCLLQMTTSLAIYGFTFYKVFETQVAMTVEEWYTDLYVCYGILYYFRATIVLYLLLGSLCNIAYHGYSLSHLDKILGIFHVAGIEKNVSNFNFGIFYWIFMQSLFYLCHFLMEAQYNKSKDTIFLLTIAYATNFPICISSTILTRWLILVKQASQNLNIVNAELELISERKMTSEHDAKVAQLHPKKTELRQIDILRRLASPERDSLFLNRIMIFWRVYDEICDFTWSLDKTYSLKLVMIFLESLGTLVYRISKIFLISCGVTNGWFNNKGFASFYVVIGLSLLEVSLRIIQFVVAISTCSQCKNLVRMMLL